MYKIPGDPYSEGFDAYWNEELSYLDNPYSLDTDKDKWTEWSKGWFEALDDWFEAFDEDDS